MPFNRLNFSSYKGVTYVSLVVAVSVHFCISFNEGKKGHLWLKQLKHRGLRSLNETSEHESRVALTPDIVTRLRKSGVNCLIESGAGVASHYVDEDYSKAGAQVVSADEVIARADVLGFVDRPSSALLGRVKQGTWIIGMLGSFTEPIMSLRLKRPVWSVLPWRSCRVS